MTRTLLRLAARLLDRPMRTPSSTLLPALYVVRPALPTPDAAAGGATPTRPVRRGSPAP